MIKNRKHLLLGIFSFCMVATLSFLLAKNMTQSNATMAGFKAGNIISDYVMSNYNSMNESQIQSFLKSKNSCNDTAIYKANQYPNYDYHIVNGHFVCMADESFNGESAAHIIWQAAQDYRINPQVLIVLLQKEQGLVTDTWPNSNHQYRSATGYGCPDTAACDSQYYGFKNQVRNAAELYRWILDHGSKYYPLGWNDVRYNPNAACGSSRIYIENNATAALYQYTPYQPNQSAINAGYGSGDACGAYGNRNFYNYFTDWFGDAHKTYQTVSIPDGEYYIQSELSKSKVLDIAADNNIQLYEKNNSARQVWKITKGSDGYYTIINPQTNKAIDLFNAGTDNGTNIQLFNSNGTCAQKWKFILINQSVSIISACASSMAIDVYNASIANNTNIQLFNFNETNAQKWQFIPKETIEEGYYTIFSALNTSKVMDINGGSFGANDGRNIQLYESNDTTAQHWYIKSLGDGLYNIINPHTGKALDVAGAEISDGTNVQLYAYNNTCAQKWRIIKNDDNRLIFLSACSYKSIDVYNGFSQNGTNIQIYSYNGTKAQKWLISDYKQNAADIDQEATYTIFSELGYSKVIDIYGGFSQNGTNIQLYDANKTEAQKWKIIYDQESDLYIIKNPKSGKVIDVSGAGVWNGTNIQLYSFNGTCAQKWSIIKSNNKYQFFSACSRKALDVYNGLVNNNTNIQLYESNNTKAQKWTLTKI